MTASPEMTGAAPRPARTWALRNGRIYDGTGARAFAADLVIEDDRILSLEGPGTTGDELEGIDVGGATVSPGFIDVHSHADNAPFLTEDDTSKILQGVTTEVVGNCGFSLAPCVDANIELHQRYLRRLFPEFAWGWRSMDGFFETIDQHGYVTNYAPLVGHHALRIAAMGMADRPPDDAEQATMRGLLADALGAGAFGLSTGLIYPPGVFSKQDEISRLVASMPDEAVYATHMRGESMQLFASLAEAIGVAEATGRRVQISHLKVAGRKQWGAMDRALGVLDESRARGTRLQQDVYPYTAGSTMLSAALPPWCQEGGDAQVLERLQDARSVARLRDDLARDDGSWENHAMSAGWDGVVVASSPSHTFDGESIGQIAARLGLEPVDALVEVLLTDELKVSMIVHSIDEPDLETALAHPLTMIGSDGLPPGTGGKPHPRTYGTFPRVLGRYVRERDVLGLADAIHRMTGLPADGFGLVDRGVVAEGRVADLVVFDDAVVADRATFETPVAHPVGLKTVIQSGNIAVDGGRWLGRRLGRRLERGG